MWVTSVYCRPCKAKQRQNKSGELITWKHLSIQKTLTRQNNSLSSAFLSWQSQISFSANLILFFCKLKFLIKKKKFQMPTNIQSEGNILIGTAILIRDFLKAKRQILRGAICELILFFLSYYPAYGYLTTEQSWSITTKKVKCWQQIWFN